MPNVSGTQNGSAAYDLQQILDDLIAIAKVAGETMLAARPSVLTSGSKNNSADLVTETDQAIEKVVLGTLKAKYPTYSFLGEETYVPGMRLTDAPTFICDPIDGTVNFVHGFPNFCISLAFALNRKPLVGVIYQPSLSALYTAISGRGSYYNLTTRLPFTLPYLAPLSTLSRTLCAIEWGSDRSGPNWECKYNTFRTLAAAPSEGGKIVHSLRSMGSAALNFCAVAKGEVDLYWEGGCWAWDVAAGWVILEEAGGVVVDANPGGWEIAVDGRKYLAVRACEGGREQQNALIEEFWTAVKGKYDYEP
ncbi:inositol monophosphatase [Tirmania nivea]|nr:inositol monophosphatase [Tirmania nivea]